MTARLPASGWGGEAGMARRTEEAVVVRCKRFASAHRASIYAHRDPDKMRCRPS